MERCTLRYAYALRMQRSITSVWLLGYLRLIDNYSRGVHDHTFFTPHCSSLPGASFANHDSSPRRCDGFYGSPAAAWYAGRWDPGGGRTGSLCGRASLAVAARLAALAYYGAVRSPAGCCPSTDFLDSASPGLADPGADSGRHWD